MRISVLGASGYIGSFLVDRLKKKHSVISHSRKKIKNYSFKKKIYKNIYGDIKKKSVLKKILDYKPDLIIYTISLNHFESEKNLKFSVKNNFEPLKNLVEMIIQKNLNTKIIYFSTMQVLGREYKKKLIKETNQKNLNNFYALTHSMCEDFLINNSLKIDSLILRLSNAFGMPVLKNINCWWLVLNDFCRSAIIKKKIIINSDGTALRDFISLGKISQTVEKILKKKKFTYKIMNLCSGNTLSIKEIANIVSKNSYFKENIPVIVKKKKKKKKTNFFRYDVSRMKKIGIYEKSDLNIQIKNFLKEINLKYTNKKFKIIN